MQYIIPTENELQSLNKLFMNFDNTEINIEYCLGKIRLAVNEYALPPAIMDILSDTMLGAATDKQMFDLLMSEWLRLIIKIHYYIVTADMQLPILEFILQRNDICVITEG